MMGHLLKMKVIKNVVVRQRTDMLFLVGCDVTGSTGGSSKDLKLVLLDFLEWVVFRDAEKFVGAGGESLRSDKLEKSRDILGDV